MRRAEAFGMMLLGLALVAGCGEDSPIPRPRGFFRIEMPERQWREVESPCGPRFEVATYAGAVPADNGGSADGFCGFNVAFPMFQAVLHCTYVELSGSEQLDKLVEDAHNMAFNHDIKATGIGRQQFEFAERGVFGLVYNLEGPVATPVQFYATDSLMHYLRGSLYFAHEPQPDSLRPSLEHIRDDLAHLIETLQWPQ